MPELDSDIERETQINYDRSVKRKPYDKCLITQISILFKSDTALKLVSPSAKENKISKVAYFLSLNTDLK